MCGHQSLQLRSPSAEPEGSGKYDGLLGVGALRVKEHSMTEIMNLPVLPLADDVVLPGMVAPITLDGEAQAAIDAARSASDDTLVLVPRVGGAYNADGVVATI